MGLSPVNPAQFSPRMVYFFYFLSKHLHTFPEYDAESSICIAPYISGYTAQAVDSYWRCIYSIVRNSYFFRPVPLPGAKSRCHHSFVSLGLKRKHFPWAFGFAYGPNYSSAVEQTNVLSQGGGVFSSRSSRLKTTLHTVHGVATVPRDRRTHRARGRDVCMTATQRAETWS